MVVTFCGHSQYTESVEDEQKILSLLTELVGDSHAELYLGGYGSFDAFARKCGRKYQETHPNTELVLVTPYIKTDYPKDRYDDILYPELESVPPKFAISRRNQWMAEHADYIIAYINHDWGGAHQMYQHAKRKRKPLFNLTEKIF